MAKQLAVSGIQDDVAGAEKEEDDTDRKRHQSRGGKALPRDTTKQKSKEEVKKKVRLARASDGPEEGPYHVFFLR